MPRPHQRRQLMNVGDFFQENHAELRRMAGHHFRSERPSHTLQPTALVNEAFVRLQTGHLPASAEPKKLFAMASRAMERILIEHARRRNAEKRGGKLRRVTIDDAEIVVREPDLLEIKMAISRLAIHDAALARVAELRLVGGFSTKEAASILDRGQSTVRRDCRRAGERLRQYVLAAWQ